MELNELHEKYNDKGLSIVAFPCNQFLNQEPGSNAQVESFARTTMGAKFLLMSKVNVNGPDAHIVFRFLKKATDEQPVNWNFNKVRLTH